MSESPFVPAAGRDWLLPLYDPLTRLLGVERAHRRLLDQAALGPGARVLEIGCGTGNLTLLARRLYPTAEVVGTDPDPKALVRAGRKAERAGLPVRFEQAHAERLPVPDASFDRVLSALMFHHLPADARLPALREARRVLKPGGSLHLVDFDQGRHAHGLHQLFVRLIRSHQPPSARRSVLELMGEAGFADPQAVAHQTGIMGRVAYYRAAAAA